MLRLHSFADETPLHGFALAVKSGSKADLFGWLLLAILCVGMTVEQTVLMIQLYQTEPTAVAISWRAGESMNLDKMVINLPHDIYIGSFSKYNSTELASLLKQTDVNYFSQQQDGEEFNWPLNKYILVMFRQIAQSESGLKTNEDSSAFNWGYIMGASGFGDFNVVSKDNLIKAEVLSNLHGYFKANNVSLIPLLKLTLSRLCNKIFTQFQNSYVNEKFYKQIANEEELVTNGRSISDLCAPENVAYFDDKNMAFKLSSVEQPVILASMQDTLTMTFCANPNILTATYSEIEAVNVTGSYQIFLDGRTYANSKRKSAENMLSERLQTAKCASVRIRTAYSFLNLKRKPCLPASTTFECENLCFANLVNQNCNCWPVQTFLFQQYRRTIPFCGEGNSSNNSWAIPHLEICVNGKDIMRSLALCQAACLPQCETREYEFLWKETNLFCNPSEGYLGDTTLVLTADTFSYPLIEETLLKDWQTFLNEFGGLIGVWLGGSLIAFVHIPIFFFKFAYLRMRKKQADAKSPMQHVIYTHTEL